MSGKQRLQGSANQFAKSEDFLVRDVVNHAGSVTTTTQDARLGQGLEVSGGIGLSQSSFFHQVGDRQFAPLQGSDEFQSAGLPEDSKSGRDEIEGFVADITGGNPSHTLALGHGFTLAERRVLFQQYAQMLIK